jgi:hypothetical protein
VLKQQTQTRFLVDVILLCSPVYDGNMFFYKLDAKTGSKLGSREVLDHDGGVILKKIVLELILQGFYFISSQTFYI